MIIHIFHNWSKWKKFEREFVKNINPKEPMNYYEGPVEKPILQKHYEWWQVRECKVCGKTEMNRLTS